MMFRRGVGSDASSVGRDSPVLLAETLSSVWVHESITFRTSEFEVCGDVELADDWTALAGFEVPMTSVIPS